MQILLISVLNLLSVLDTTNLINRSHLNLYNLSSIFNKFLFVKYLHWWRNGTQMML